MGNEVDPLLVFELRAWARAVLVDAGEMTLHDAVDGLWADAEASSLADWVGVDALQHTLATKFRDVI